MTHPDRTIAPAVKPLPLLNIPDAQWQKLSNGIDFATYSGGFQPVCRLSFIFQGGLESGSSLYPKFVLSQLVEGTEQHTGDEIAEILDFYGVKVSHRFYDHHSLIEFSMLNDTVEAMLPLISELLTCPSFPADRLATARSRALTAYRTARTQMPNLAAEEMQRLLYGPDHLCGRVDDEASIEAITPEGCKECFWRLMQPATMTVALSGLLDNALIAKVKATLEKMQGVGHGYDIVIEAPKPVPTPYVKDLGHKESYQAAVMVGIPTVLRSHPDYEDIRLSVTALGGYFGRRLMKNIREDKGLTYGISASLNGTHDFSYVNIAATCDRSFTEQVLREIEAEMNDLAANPPEGDELHRLKLFAQSNLASLLDAPWEIMNYHTQPLLIGTPPGYFAAQQRAIEALTPERIAAIAGQYITMPRSITVIA